MSDVTTILGKIKQGHDRQAMDELANLVYEELRIVALSRLKVERPGHTLQPTALIHEAWLKLFPNGQNRDMKNSRYFFGAAGRAMRCALIDYNRMKTALKRGEKVEVSETEFEKYPLPDPNETVFALNEALTRYAEIDQTAVTLIELRYFGGMTMAEAAQAVDIAQRNGERLCAGFMAWFREQYNKGISI